MKIAFFASLLGLFGLLGLLSLGLPGWGWLVRVREHNLAQAQGEAAARRGLAEDAALHYGQAGALAGRGGPSPELLLNLAQAQTLAGQRAAARGTYARLLGPSVPPAVGGAARQQLANSLAEQGQLPQAIGLLRQALHLDPNNATARYNYELLSEYLAGQPTGNAAAPAPAPTSTAPSPARQPPGRDSAAQKTAESRPKPAQQKGQPQAEQKSGPGAGQQKSAPNQPPNQPDPSGQPDAARPTPNSGAAAPQSLRPGPNGAQQPLPVGAQPGTQPGLDAGSQATSPNAPVGRGRLPGTEVATAADRDLQTQRERLRTMSLSPAQAQQLLDALRAGEQQYLQQRPPPRTGAPPAPGQPTW